MAHHLDARTSTQRPTAAGARSFIFLVVFLDLLGSTILIPVGAYIVRQYNTDALAVGLMSVIYSAAQFLAAPILGRLSDRFGRRPVLLLSVFGSAIGYFIFGIGGALWILLLSRLIDGITGGNLSTAQAYIADVTPPQDRASSFALIGAAYGLGFILGPAIGGVLGQINLALPAFASGALSLISVIFGYFVLPESLPKDKRDTRSLSWADINPIAAILEVVRLPNLGVLLLATFIFNFAFNGMVNNLGVFTIEKFGVQPLELAIMLTLGGIANVIVQVTVIQRSLKFGVKNLALTGLTIQTLFYAAIVLMPSFAALCSTYAVICVGSALTFPTLGALVSNNVSARDQGKASGASTSLISLTNIFGPFWTSAAYDHIMTSAPYWSSAILLALALLLVVRVKPSAPPVTQFIETQG